MFLDAKANEKEIMKQKENKKDRVKKTGEKGIKKQKADTSDINTKQNEDKREI